MKIGIKRVIKVIVLVIVFIIPILVSLWYVPYQISYDEHMVSTVNERAHNYEPANQTITDFAQAEIIKSDAQLLYENRCWKLDHLELYSINAIIWGSVFGILIMIVCVFGLSFIEEFNIFDEEDISDDCIPMELVEP